MRSEDENRTRRRGNLPDRAEFRGPRVYQMHAGDDTTYYDIGSSDEPIYFDIDGDPSQAQNQTWDEQGWESAGLDHW